MRRRNLDYWKLWRIVFAIIPFIFSYLLIDTALKSKILILIYSIASTICFILYGIDKNRAESSNNKTRISENTLHLWELIGGWSGALIGQVVFKHKTQKKGFVGVLYAIVVIHFVGWGFWWFYF